MSGTKAYLRNGVLHDLLVLHIALVTDEQLVDTLGGVSVNLLKPLLDVVEGVHVGHIVNNADTVGTTVVRRSDGTEAFLASSVPLEKKVKVRSARVHAGAIHSRVLREEIVRSGVSRSCHRAR